MSKGREAGDRVLSVVIVSFNTCDLLHACLASLVEASESPSFVAGAATAERAEIIVVDNGSVDGSVEMVEREFPGALLLRMGENVGFARACNAGILASEGRYIALLNSDTVVLDSALSRQVVFLDENPGFAAVGPLLLNGDETVQTSCFAFTTVTDILFEQLGLSALFPRSALFNRRGLGGFDRKSVREVDWVSGACLMVRRQVVQQVGLLDEGFFMYGEELDWCLRMKQAGLRTAFYPAARVIHFGRGSSTHTRAELAPRALAGRLRYFNKHHGRLAVVAVRVLMVLGMSLRLAALPVRALVRPASIRADLDWYWGLLRAAGSFWKGGAAGAPPWQGTDERS